jgi:membrane protease subunit (stomatin/prohibitin family)
MTINIHIEKLIDKLTINTDQVTDEEIKNQVVSALLNAIKESSVVDEPKKESFQEKLARKMAETKRDE